MGARSALVLACAVLLHVACLEWPARGAERTQGEQILTSKAQYRKEYVYAPGDQIQVVVRRAPEASATVVIRPDGFISLPLLDEVPAAGLTTPELTAKISALLAPRLQDPEVHVIAVQTRPPSVYVIGEVGIPSSIPLRSVRTAMQAIGTAGGFRRSAAMTKVIIIRLAEDGHLQAIPVKVPGKGQTGPVLALGDAALQADDLIFVPESGRSAFTRFLDDFINKPLTGITSLVATYLDFRLISLIK